MHPYYLVDFIFFMKFVCLSPHTPTHPQKKWRRKKREGNHKFYNMILVSKCSFTFCLKKIQVQCCSRFNINYFQNTLIAHF